MLVSGVRECHHCDQCGKIDTKEYRLGIHNSTWTWVLFEARMTWDGCAFFKTRDDQHPNMVDMVDIYLYEVFLISVNL